MTPLAPRQRWRRPVPPHQAHHATHMARTIVAVEDGEIIYNAARRTDVQRGLRCFIDTFRAWVREHGCVLEESCESDLAPR